MPVGLSVGGGYTYSGVRSHAATPTLATVIPTDDPVKKAWLIRLGGSHPLFDTNGFINTDIIINPPAGTAAPSVATTLKVFMRTYTAGSVVIYGNNS